VFFLSGIAFWLVAATYLAGDLIALFPILVFLTALFAPLSTIVTSCLSRFKFPPYLCASLGFLLTFMMLIPLYLIRKWLALPLLYFDAITCLSLLSFRYYYFKNAICAGDIESFPKLFWVMQFFVIPLILCLNWAGFEVHFKDAVGYFDLHLVDSGTLSGIISTISASPFKPLSLVSGLGELNYHWFFFTIPAFFSDFMGFSVKHSNAMALSNLLMGNLMFLTLYEVAGLYLKDGLEKKHIQCISSALILLSSDACAFYLPTLDLSLPPNNNLLLSIVYSINYFGNNTMALVCILHAILLIPEWNSSSRPAFVIVIATLFAATAGLSITLSFSVMSGLLLLFMFRKIEKPATPIAIGLVVGAVFLVFYKYFGVFGGNHGSNLGVKFDNGRFLQNFFFWFLPAIIVSFYGLTKSRKNNHFVYFILASLLIPTFLMIKNSPIGRLEFCMKTATLLIAMLTPLFAQGIEWMIEQRKLIRTIFPAILLTLGTVSFGSDISTFIIKRAHSNSNGLVTIPKNYFDALVFVRQHTLPKEIVIDPFFEDQKEAHISTIVSQRRLYLTIKKDFNFAKIPEEVKNRRILWNTWVESGFKDTQISEYFSANAHYIVATSSISDTNWQQIFRKGEYRVFRSKKQPEVKHLQTPASNSLGLMGQ
jgi:hypothetical protein